jgi:hypothetical protein
MAIFVAITGRLSSCQAVIPSSGWYWPVDELGAIGLLFPTGELNYPFPG